MNALTSIIVIAAFILVLIVAIAKARNAAAVSKPDIIEHPSAFKKPEVAMTQGHTTAPLHEGNGDSTADFEENKKDN